MAGCVATTPLPDQVWRPFGKKQFSGVRSCGLRSCGYVADLGGHWRDSGRAPDSSITSRLASLGPVGAWRRDRRHQPRPGIGGTKPDSDVDGHESPLRRSEIAVAGPALAVVVALLPIWGTYADPVVEMVAPGPVRFGMAAPDHAQRALGSNCSVGVLCFPPSLVHHRARGQVPFSLAAPFHRSGGHRGGHVRRRSDREMVPSTQDQGSPTTSARLGVIGGARPSMDVACLGRPTRIVSPGRPAAHQIEDPDVSV
jgi:hypothetical protein